MAKDLQTYLSNRRTRLPRPISIAEAAQAIADHHNQHGGATYSLYFGNVAGQNLYAVCLYPERSSILHHKSVSVRQIEQFVADNFDLLTDPRLCVGTWYEETEELTYLDVTATLPDKDLVLRLGSLYNQIAIFDLASKEVVYTGGSGDIADVDVQEDQRLPPLARQGGNAND